jgi:hypothetical protein
VYIKKFNYLTQYDRHNMDTDAKKMDLLKKALSAQLREHLTLFYNCNFNELVSASIEQEDASHAHTGEEERKSKRPMSGPPRAAPPMYRLVYTPPMGEHPRQFSQPL